MNGFDDRCPVIMVGEKVVVILKGLLSITPTFYPTMITGLRSSKSFKA